MHRDKVLAALIGPWLLLAPVQAQSIRVVKFSESDPFKMGEVTEPVCFETWF
jgi:hypothetical protein